MSITSYWDFIDNIHSLNVSGVKTQIKYPPQDVNGEDLPLQFVHLPESPDELPITFDGGGGWPTLQAQLVVLVEPVVGDTQKRNYDDAVRMMDNVAAALRSAECGLAKSAPRWAIRLTTVAVGEIVYWAVTADIEARG